MARKTYSEQFRRQAVDLYRSTPGATLRGIAADLGISRHTLNVWVRALDAGTTSTTTSSTAGLSRSDSPGRADTPEAELAALRAQVTALETDNAKLETERDILRQAAKYFAGETNW
jgi:transposase